MPDYEKMYHIMFNAATESERLAVRASEILRNAQLECEELYIAAADMEADNKPNIKAAGV